MQRQSIACATWYEALHCWIDPGECNTDYPVEDVLGVFRTKLEAKKAGEGKGLKLLTEKEYRLFHERMGPTGYVIKEHLVLFLGRSRTMGRVVGDKNIALSFRRASRPKKQKKK